MHRTVTSACIAVAFTALATANSLHAQDASAGLRADLLHDIGVLEQKVVSLAEAMDESQYDWRPMEGVRSVRDVYLHVAGTNFFFPTLAGVAAPGSSSITGNYSTVEAFEAAGGTKEHVVASLRASFTHLRDALEQTTDFERMVNLFGRRASVRAVWLETVTHIHEHLGQSVAYARANHVVPPWSR